MFTKAVGTKFHPDGTLRYFPGNTVISKCPGIEPLFSELVWAQEQFKQLPFARKFAFLPPTSFHMTVFEFLCDQVRDAAHWSRLIAQDAPLTEVDAVLRGIFERLDHPGHFTMEFKKIEFRLAIGLVLQPADSTVAAQLKQYRELLAEHTGIRFPNHDTYQFHIGLAYNLVKLTEAEHASIAEVQARVDDRLLTTIKTFTVPGPEFVMFHDMGDFQTNLAR